MNAPDHLAQVRQLRTLAGTTRPTDSLLQDMHTAARRLEAIIGGWATFAPRLRTIQEAEHAVEGLRRSLIDLRSRVAPDAPEAA